ncbi:Post-transcriptional regulator [Paenibacillus sp. GP183]|nr:Post-transcriptional regulator [Paenibacillus sp. GP183]
MTSNTMMWKNSEGGLIMSEEDDILEQQETLDSILSERHFIEKEHHVLSENELNEVIESLCLSKVEEFKLLGYDHVTGKEIWDCVSDRYRKSGMPALHQIVNDILSLKSTQFMNWMTMSAFKGAQF